MNTENIDEVGVDHVTNLFNFNLGWEFARADLNKRFGYEVGEKIEAAVLEDVMRARKLRENLISLKKVYKHLTMRCHDLEKRMSQFASLFYVDGKDWLNHLLDEELIHDEARPVNVLAELYGVCAKGLQQARALVTTSVVARSTVRGICTVPRHLEDPYEIVQLELLPYRFAFYGFLRDCWKKYEDILQGYVTKEDLFGPEDPEFKTIHVRKADTKKFVQSILQKAYDVMDPITTTQDDKDFIAKVFLARGMSKAFRIQVETRHLRQSLAKSLPVILTMKTRMADLYKQDRFEYFKLTRPAVFLDTVYMGAKELYHWLGCILEDPTELYFVAGDSSNSSSFTPASFGVELFQTIDNMDKIIERYYPHLEKRLMDILHQTPECPPWATMNQLRGESGKGKLRPPCIKCKEIFAKPFMNPQSNICVICETNARNSLRSCFERQTGELLVCPLKCGKKMICPHDLRCFDCEKWSCEECNVIRCDSEEALQQIQDAQPSILFFDFDRTFASTRSGQNPLEQKFRHQVDDSLKTAALEHRNVHIVTRNSNQQAITKFLHETHNLPHIQVHSLKHFPEADTKLDIMKALMKPEDHAVFCDDDTREILHPTLREFNKENNNKIRAILFTRTTK